MKNITIWASENIYLSRLLITLGLIVLYFTTSFVGFFAKSKYQGSFAHAEAFILLLTIIPIVVAFYSYPSKVQRRSFIEKGRGVFRKWKIYDMALIGSFCLLGFHFGYMLDQQKISEQPGIVPIIEVLSFNPVLEVANTHSYNVDGKGKIKRFIDKKQQQIKDFFQSVLAKYQDQKYSVGALIGLMIAFAAVYFILFYLLAFLYCNIACGGSPVLAIIILIVGELLLLAGLSYAVYGTKNWLERKRGNEPNKKKNLWFGIISSLVIGILSIAIPSLLG